MRFDIAVNLRREIYGAVAEQEESEIRIDVFVSHKKSSTKNPV